MPTWSGFRTSSHGPYQPERASEGIGYTCGAGAGLRPSLAHRIRRGAGQVVYFPPAVLHATAMSIDANHHVRAFLTRSPRLRVALVEDVKFRALPPARKRTCFSFSARDLEELHAVRHLLGFIDFPDENEPPDHFTQAECILGSVDNTRMRHACGVERRKSAS